MAGYVCAADLKADGAYKGIISEVDLLDLSDAALDNLLQTGREMIDSYCGKSFDNAPAIVKVVNVKLLSAFLADTTKKGEGTGDYSYTSNMSAFSHILSMLDLLDIDGETIVSQKKSVRMRVI